MKKERLQQMMQKYKETIMSNDIAVKWINWKKWTDS